jgi:hypothetical protein
MPRPSGNTSPLGAGLSGEQARTILGPGPRRHCHACATRAHRLRGAQAASGGCASRLRWGHRPCPGRNSIGGPDRRRCQSPLHAAEDMMAGRDMEFANLRLRPRRIGVLGLRLHGPGSKLGGLACRTGVSQYQQGHECGATALGFTDAGTLRLLLPRAQPTTVSCDNASATRAQQTS